MPSSAAGPCVVPPVAVIDRPELAAAALDQAADPCLGIGQETLEVGLERDPALVQGEGLLERLTPSFELRDDPLERLERGVEAERLDRGLGLGRAGLLHRLGRHASPSCSSVASVAPGARIGVASSASA